MQIQKKLHWLIQMGINSFCGETPQKTLSTVLAKEDPPATLQAQTTASQAKDLPALNSEKTAFTLSSLKKTAAHTILGQGPTSPKLMCVMEAPDADTDRSGQTFSGPQGDQFSKMMQAIKLDVAHDVYLTYLSPWRTPGNRPLTETERALFLPFLLREIDLVQPQKILLFGAGVANALLKTESLAKARGQWHNYQDIPVRVTLSLSALKTTPLRRQAWDDLQAVEKG